MACSPCQRTKIVDLETLDIYATILIFFYYYFHSYRCVSALNYVRFILGFNASELSFWVDAS